MKRELLAIALGALKTAALFGGERVAKDHLVAAFPTHARMLEWGLIVIVGVPFIYWVVAPLTRVLAPELMPDDDKRS